MPLRAFLILRSERSERLEGRTAVMQGVGATGIDNVHGLFWRPNAEAGVTIDGRPTRIEPTTLEHLFPDDP